MGVSGCGKTTVGRALAARLGWQFEDGDDHHSPANKEKMRSGDPLTEADRLPWLDTLAGMIRQRNDSEHHTVLACSALTRAARDRLGCAADDVLLVHLIGSMELIELRMQDRTHEYMPDSLLQSQFKTLQPPSEAERAIKIKIDQPIDVLVNQIWQAL